MRVLMMTAPTAQKATENMGTKKGSKSTSKTDAARAQREAKQEVAAFDAAFATKKDELEPLAPIGGLLADDGLPSEADIEEIKADLAYFEKEKALTDAPAHDKDAETIDADGADEPPPESSDDDEEDAPPVGTEERKSYDKRNREMGPARLRAVQFRKFNARLDKVEKAMLTWGEDSDVQTALVAIRSARVSLSVAVSALELKPMGWRPATSARPAGVVAGVKLVEGQTCTIREKAQKGYLDVFSSDEMKKPLVVVAIGKQKVKVKSATGDVVFIPRGHLVPIEEVAKAAE